MRIAVIGSAPSSVHLAPVMDGSYNTFLGGKPPPQYPPSDFIDQDWQLWVCSPGAFGAVGRADRWFELHRWEPGKTWFSPEYVQFLKEFRGIVYTGGPVEGLRNGVVYDIERVESEFSAYFLTSSLALMLAQAILEIEDARRARASGPQCLGELRPGEATPAGNVPPEEDTIGLWGVDMAAHEEWGYQRPGCQFFILEALRRGIGVYVPRESDVLRPMPVYGISEWDHNYIKATARMRELNTRKETAQAQIGQSTQTMQFLAGASDNMNYMINTWFSPYGVPAGCRIEIAPGTGLGGGITMPRPFSLPEPEAAPIVQTSVQDTTEVPVPPAPRAKRKPKTKAKRKPSGR